MKKLLLSLIILVATITTSSAQVVISEIYGGGGNSGAFYKNDFIELYNAGTSPVNVTGWSVQYASAGGTSWQKTTLSGTIPAKGFFLVQEGAGANALATELPTADAVGSIALSGTAGKIALCNDDISLTGSSNPSTAAVLDLVGFGSSANFYEGFGTADGGPTSAPSNTRSIERKAKVTSNESSMSTGGADEFEGNGFDSNNNKTDFFTRAPQPQNSANTTEPDFDAPAYVAGYPQATNLNKASFDLLINLNEKGTSYFVLLAQGSAAPTAAQVKAGTDASGNAVTKSGSVQIEEPFTEYSTSFSGLTGNTTYSVFVVSEDANLNLQATPVKVDATTSATAQPDITPAIASLAFDGVTSINKTSAATSLSFTASDLTSDVLVSVSGNFLISKTENGTYSTNTLTFAKQDFADAAAQNIFVKFNPESTFGAQNGSITLSTENSSDDVVTLSAISIDPYNQNFNSSDYLSTSGWSQINVNGGKNTWGYTTATPNSAPGSAIMNGYSDSEGSNDWLVSPSLDLSGFSNYSILSFFSRKFFAGPALKLYVSTTYNDSGIINVADWTEIEGDFPALTGNWQLSDNLDLTSFKSANTHIAFVYQSVAGGSNNTSEWKVDDFKVENLSQFNSIKAADLSFNETTAGSVSESQQYSFRAAGYGAITLAASEGFEVSKNGTSFSSSITVTEAEAYAGQTVSIRFAPQSRKVKFEGTVTFTGTGLNIAALTLSGSSILKSETFDIAAWNLEFFGSDVRNASGLEFGPTNDALQISNVSSVMKKLGLDIYAVEEVSDTVAFSQLVASLPGYAQVLSNRFSYSFAPADPNFPAQQVGFIYNTQTISKLSEEVLFESLFDSLRAGTATLENYPGTSGSFWSSGRLPYMVTFNAKIANKTQTYRVIVLHAKSGSATADYNRRKYDVDYLYTYLAANYKNDNIIILGDYNDDVDNSIRTGYITSYEKFVADADNYNTLTRELSTQEGIGTFVGGNTPSFIDHIITSNDLNDQYLENSITIEDARKYVASYSTTTSDHLPIYARFSLPEVAPKVNLTAFNAVVSGKSVQITWTTSSEFNNAYFTVERSNSGNKFEELTRVNGSVYNANEKSYVVFDDYPYNGNSYYRLKQTNLDGTFTYSNVVQVKLTGPKNHQLVVYPNPVQGAIQLTFVGEAPNATTVLDFSVMNVDGRSVLSGKGNLNSLNESLQSRLKELTPGVYVVQISTTSSVSTAKFIKQ
ncbi:MAG: lamin tail domain-containing protein [Daejeonella sp.]